MCMLSFSHLDPMSMSSSDISSGSKHVVGNAYKNTFVLLTSNAVKTQIKRHLQVLLDYFQMYEKYY